MLDEIRNSFPSYSSAKDLPAIALAVTKYAKFKRLCSGKAGGRAKNRLMILPDRLDGTLFIQQRATSNEHPASSNEHPASSIQKPASRNQHPETSIQHPASRTSNEQPETSNASLRAMDCYSSQLVGLRRSFAIFTIRSRRICATASFFIAGRGSFVPSL